MRHQRAKHPLQIQLEETVRSQGKADGTAAAYWIWIERFMQYCKQCTITKESHSPEEAVTEFLTHLTVRQNVSANTQNQAFSALCYFFTHVRKRPLVGVQALRAKRPDAIRDILDQSEIITLFEQLSGIELLAARIMYGCGLRIGDLACIRMKDISFERKQIQICRGKQGTTRRVGFPELLHDSVRRQMESMRVLWEHDKADGLNGVSLPHRFGVKSKSAHLDFAWWYLFASDHYSRDPVTGRMFRHHRDMDNIARHIRDACREAGIPKRITSHCLRHSFATHSLESGVPIHFVQKLLGHKNIETTMVYVHASKDGATAARSPLEDVLAQQQTDNRPVTLKLFAG